MDSEKKAKKSISFPPSLYERALEIATRDYRGNVSALVSDALEAYLGGSGGSISNPREETCLVDLADQVVPFFSSEMREACKDLDQPKALALMLMNFAGGKSGVSKKFLKDAQEFIESP
jgi:hypothetical protein